MLSGTSWWALWEIGKMTQIISVQKTSQTPFMSLCYLHALILQLVEAEVKVGVIGHNLKSAGMQSLTQYQRLSRNQQGFFLGGRWFRNQTKKGLNLIKMSVYSCSLSVVISPPCSAFLLRPFALSMPAVAWTTEHREEVFRSAELPRWRYHGGSRSQCARYPFFNTSIST